MNIRKKSFSAPIRWLFLITGIEWLFLGITDPIASLFVESIIQDYSIIGIIFSIRSLFALISIFFLNKIFEKGFFPLIEGLFLSRWVYFFVSLGFFIAGYFSLAWFLFFLFAINGVLISIRSLTTESYLLANTNKHNAPSILGINIAVKNFFWIIGLSFCGLIFFLIGDRFDTHSDILPFLYLFLTFSYTVQIILFQGHKKSFRKVRWKNFGKKCKQVIVEDKIFLHLLKKMKKFSFVLNFSLLLFFFLQMLIQMITIFIPLLGLEMNLPIPHIVLLTLAMFFPLIFTFFFSLYLGKYNRINIVLGGLFFSFFPLALLSFTSAPLFIGILTSFLSFSVAMLQPAVLGITAINIPLFEKRSVIALEHFFSLLGRIFGGVFIGFVAKFWGIQIAFFFMAILSGIFIIIAFCWQDVFRSITHKEKSHKRHIHEEVYFSNQHNAH
jgi:MFS family permease